MTAPEVERLIKAWGQASRRDTMLPYLGTNTCGEVADLLATTQRDLAEARAERDDARAKLFPYADATEISGMSWNGFYLIGDKKSISELRRIENRAAQIDVYRAAFDARAEASDRRIEALEKALRDAKTFHDRDSGCNGFTADYEILRYEIDAALQKEPQP